MPGRYRARERSARQPCSASPRVIAAATATGIHGMVPRLPSHEFLDDGRVELRTALDGRAQRKGGLDAAGSGPETALAHP
jgi:hypothetical protein